MFFKGNAFDCRPETEPDFRWIFTSGQFRNQISDAICNQTGSSVFDFKWNETEVVLCNKNGEFNGQFGREWPVVRAGQYSEAKCLFSEGVMRWKCLSTGSFDPDGPEMDGCFQNVKYIKIKIDFKIFL